MKRMKPYNIIVLLLVALTFLMSLAFYNYLPDTMVSHWDISGNPNGYMPKETDLLLLPLIGAAIVFLLFFIPRIDPLKKNIKKFQSHYELFIVNFAVFFLYIHTITILINMGVDFNLIQAMSIGLAVLLYSLGSLVGAAKRNYFIGIRTPWTLDCDEIWDKTHRLGGKLFKACAVITLFGAAFPSIALLFTLASIIVVAIFLVAYSYFEYKKLHWKTKKPSKGKKKKRKK